jgi:hypothetical protein
MKLNEFQVFDGCSGLPGQGNSFTTCLGWVGGVGEEMSAASTGQHHGPSLHGVQQATIEHLDATAASVFDSQLGDPHTTAMQQAFPFFDAFPQYIHESASGLVLHV